MNITEVVQQIQYVVAPAIMISSSALLLLGFQNKFSNIANRFRALSAEKRQLLAKPQPAEPEKIRLASLSAQIDTLLKRAKFVGRAIFCAYAGILCFTGTSLLIFINLVFPVGLWRAGIAVFGAGFAFIFASAFFMMRETHFIYRAIKIEYRS